MRSKYGNTPTVVDGIRFASKAEAKRYGELKLLMRADAMADFQRQPRYPLTVNGRKVGTYVGDFAYVPSNGRFYIGRPVCEDVKGVQTAEFKLKWALVQAIYPQIDFRIVKVRA